ncbi:MAG: TAXI family TRAP transporter solute-binding subunit [Deltaproteobacteria bacterium]|nr:TAXI family TRAP transporter solute-binding subunit [Deltaproteobacteria bacterium]
MTQPPPRPRPHARSRRAALALGLSALTGAGALWYSRRKQVVRLGTGVRDGSFFALGRTLQTVISRRAPNIQIEVISTGGSLENLALLRAGRVDLAFASSAVPPVEGLSLLTPMGDELAHILVRKSLAITDPSGLAGHAVSVGPEQSGTRYAALRILAHFGLTPGRFRPLALSPHAAEAAFAAGTVDAVFILGALRDPAVDRMLDRDDITLLSLGASDTAGSALDGLCSDAPGFERSVIPVLAYGAAPTTPIGTVRGTTYLLGRDALDPSLCASITESVFLEKVALARIDPSLARLSETFDRSAIAYPIHPGADRYFRRDAPTFLERYADPISLGMSLLAVLWSGANALRTAAQRTRLHRMDDVHREVTELEERARTASEQSGATNIIVSVHSDADTLRTRVFDQLVEGRFVADDAFRVLVLRLDGLIARCDRSLRHTH